jgi:hypothetical protein
MIRPRSEIANDDLDRLAGTEPAAIVSEQSSRAIAAPTHRGGRMSSPTTYELFAVKYAALDRPAPENFVFRDVHDGPMPMRTGGRG